MRNTSAMSIRPTLGLLLIFRARGLASNKRLSLIASRGQVAQTLEQARFRVLFTIL